MAVKYPPGFAAEPSGSHVFLQQGASAILRIAEPFLQYVHDIHANVEANEICQLQRPHRMIHPQLHYRVDGFRRGYTFHHAISRLIDERHQHAIRNKPGRVIHCHRFFPQLLRQLHGRLQIASLVCSARITSSSTMSGTGFMKCIPTNRSGRLVSAASTVTEIDDVLLAMMTSGRRMPSASPSTARLISIFSGTASTTKSAAAIAAISVTGCSRPRTIPFSASASLPFLISRSTFFPIVSIPRSRKRRSTSRRITLYPHRANACAMPFPIVPAPSTAIVLISERFKKPPETTPEATETQDTQNRQAAENFFSSLKMLFEGVAKASHAASAANFSS